MNTYVKASEKPQAGWVPPALIDDRLEAGYYNPDFVALDVQLENSGLPIDILGNIAITFTGPFGSNLPSSLYRQSGVPLLRVQNIGDFGINRDNLVFLDQPTHEKLGNSRLITGDLALAKSGSFGKIAPIWPYYGECNITEHILGIRVTNLEFDPIFLATFLASSYGMGQIKRKALGTILKYLGVQVSRSIKIPRPDPKIQNYISTKISLAEKCKEEAHQLISQAQYLFNNYLKIAEFLPDLTNFNFIQSQNLTERLAPQFYLPKFFDLERHLENLGDQVDYLANLIKEPIIRTTSPKSDNQGYPCILTSDIDAYFIEWEETSLRISSDEYNRSRGVLNAHDVVYSSIGFPAGKSAIVLGSHLPMAIGGDVSIIRTKNILNPGYLTYYLNSRFGQMQYERYARGILQRRVYPEDIASFLIPILPNHIQEEIGKRVVRFEILNKIARGLTKQAINSMECLIAGTLNTAQILSGNIQTEGWEFVEDEINREENV